MAVLVTGGAGYIGRWLAAELTQRGQHVLAVDLQPPPSGMPPQLPSGARFIQADVTDRERMRALVAQ
jgi:nucleoside-diphosphate-sugar epimerase